MSPVVRIPDELFGRLQSLAEPLVDSVGDVIKRLLDEHDLTKSAPSIPSGSQGTADSHIAGHTVNNQSALIGIEKHPNYLRVPPAVQSLHDRVTKLVLTHFNAEVRRRQSTLIYRVHDRNFAAIQRLAVRTVELDLSIFGSVASFNDPQKVVGRGRFGHWAMIRLNLNTDFDYLLDILQQSAELRLNSRKRNIS